MNRGERVVLTHHARARCEEMGVLTKRVKAIVRNPDLDYCSSGSAGTDARVASRADEPGIAVVYVPGDAVEPAVVLTVVFRTDGQYRRDGQAFIDLRDGVRHDGTTAPPPRALELTEVQLRLRERRRNGL